MVFIGSSSLPVLANRPALRFSCVSLVSKDLRQQGLRGLVRHLYISLEWFEEYFSGNANANRASILKPLAPYVKTLAIDGKDQPQRVHGIFSVATVSSLYRTGLPTF